MPCLCHPLVARELPRALSFLGVVVGRLVYRLRIPPSPSTLMLLSCLFFLPMPCLCHPLAALALFPPYPLPCCPLFSPWLASHQAESAPAAVEAPVIEEEDKKATSTGRERGREGGREEADVRGR